MAIPVIGTGVVNAPHWVYRLFYSIDYPVDTFVVFNNNGRDQITKELDLLTQIPHSTFVKLRCATFLTTSDVVGIGIY